VDADERRAARVQEELAAARRLAADAGRDDLVERLAAAAARLAERDVPVAVVGEYKQGKSTLVNAVLRTDICPVDADLVTAVPTIIRYGVPPSVVAQVLATDGSMVAQELPFERLREYVAERGGGEAAPRSVEVRLDRRLLRSGLSFVDTPGVGGLDSAQGNITLAALTLARVALFVTDAAQELTAPELDFLVRTTQRCPIVVCVVTKTDLHAEWRRIVELNRGHLARAGLSLPIVAVSSFLRLRAQSHDDSALNAESGFPRLLDVLRRGVSGAAASAVGLARAEAEVVVGQLREQVGAERAAAAAPRAGPVLVERFAEKLRRSQALAAGAGSWSTVLGDGIQDLTADVEHDLRERLRDMLRRGEELIDAGDPRDSWRDFQAWVAREATAAAVDNLLLLVSRTEQLARDVGERFDLEYESLDVDLPSPTEALARIGAMEVQFERSAMQQFLGAFTAARITYGGLYMLGAIGSLLSYTFAAPLGLIAGLTLGRKLVRQEQERQSLHRRAQAKQELRRYVDDVSFHVGRDSRDAVRRVQRFLRDEFAGRAQLAERSSATAVAAVRRTAELPEAERRRRAQTLEADWQDLDRLAGQLATRRAAA
jgi:hypothetical protein